MITQLNDIQLGAETGSSKKGKHAHAMDFEGDHPKIVIPVPANANENANVNPMQPPPSGDRR